MANNKSIQILRGTSSARANHSEASLAGQPLFETDTKKLYVGDGATPIKDLTPIRAALECAVEVTYSELKALRDTSLLVPGAQYIITDYTTKVDSIYDDMVRTASDMWGYRTDFRIIVTADSINTLNENARVTNTPGNDYYSYSDLSAWEIKYCLDNDTNRFKWAAPDGFGVIYYMKDEHGNECPYDFKGIVFQRNVTETNDPLLTEFSKTYAVSEAMGYSSATEYLQVYGDKEFFFTFSKVDDLTSPSKIEDLSIQRQSYNPVLETYNKTFLCGGNVIKPYYVSTNVDGTVVTSMQVNNIVLMSGPDEAGYSSELYSNFFDMGCCNITLLNSANNNYFGKCEKIVLKDAFCNYFADGGYAGAHLKGIYASGFYESRVGYGCNELVFGNGCSNITLMNQVARLRLYNNSNCTTIEDACVDLNFSGRAQNVVIGKYVHSLTLSASCFNLIVDPGVSSITLSNSTGTTIQNVHLCAGLSNNSNISVPGNAQYQIEVKPSNSIEIIV